MFLPLSPVHSSLGVDSTLKNAVKAWLAFACYCPPLCEAQNAKWVDSLMQEINDLHESEGAK